MWVIAGVLLGLVVLGSLIGFHAGPHVHVAAGVFGVIAAAWLVIMAVTGQSAPVLWALLSADVVVSAGIGVLAWKALSTRGTYMAGHHLGSLEGALGVAVGDLHPGGIVRVNGEDWSAVSVNGPVAAGTAVQVLKVAGVRLEVWGEETLGENGAQEIGEASGADAPGPDPRRSSSADATWEGGRS
jgi:membrane-bound ClpP family serine protease